MSGWNPWFAHEHPERPLDWAVFVCSCRACSMAIVAAAETAQTVRFVVRGQRTRRVVTVAELALAVSVGGGLADLLHGDEVRDVGVAAG